MPYTNREYYEMFRVYQLSGENSYEALRLYKEESLRRLKAHGLTFPKVPSRRTIKEVNQRLKQHGRFAFTEQNKTLSLRSSRTQYVPDPSTSEDESDEEEKAQFYKLLVAEKQLLIYTTRLEDMTIYNSKDYADDPCSLLHEIEDESKPTLTKAAMKKSKKILSKNKTLTDAEEHYREKNKRRKLNLWEVDKTNESDLLCASEVLDVVAGPEWAASETLVVSDKTEQAGNSKQDNSVDFNKNIELALANKYINRFEVLKKVRLLNKNLLELETYKMSSNDEIVSFETEDVDDIDSVFSRFPKIKIVCCWHKRMTLLKPKLEYCQSTNYRNMMRKIHDCPPGDCVCCDDCKKKGVLWKKSEDLFCITFSSDCTSKAADVVSYRDELSKIHQEPLVIPPFPSSLIDKALAKIVSINKNNSKFKKTTEIMQVTQTNVTQIQSKEWPDTEIVALISPFESQNFNSLQHLEVYEISKNGEVITFSKETTASISNSLLLSNDDGVSITTYRVCCWNKREYLINNCFSKYSSVTTKLMRKPHHCPLGGCRCCCPVDPIVIDKTNEIRKKKSLEKILTNIEPTKRKMPGKLVKIAPKPFVPAQLTTKPNIEVIINPSENPLIHSIVNNEITNLRFNNYNNTATLSPVPSPVTNVTSIIQTDDNSTQETSTTTNATVEEQEPLFVHVNCDEIADEPHPSEVKNIVHNILEKFKGLTLNIDPTGKVQATIPNLPMDNISPIEMELLKDILCRAQAVVNENVSATTLPAVTAMPLENSVSKQSLPQKKKSKPQLKMTPRSKVKKVPQIRTVKNIGPNMKFYVPNLLNLPNNKANTKKKFTNHFIKRSTVEPTNINNKLDFLDLCLRNEKPATATPVKKRKKKRTPKPNNGIKTSPVDSPDKFFKIPNIFKNILNADPFISENGLASPAIINARSVSHEVQEETRWPTFSQSAERENLTINEVAVNNEDEPLVEIDSVEPEVDPLIKVENTFESDEIDDENVLVDENMVQSDENSLDDSMIKIEHDIHNILQVENDTSVVNMWCRVPNATDNDEL